MHSVAEDDDDNIMMDVTSCASSPSHQVFIGESTGHLWSTSLSGISGLMAGVGETIYLACVCYFVLMPMIIVAASLVVPEMKDSVGA
jgi:hypothetical protein